MYNNFVIIKIDIFSDLNECSPTGVNLCNKERSTCTNTVGDYECICDAGYTLDSDGRNCLGKPKD